MKDRDPNDSPPGIDALRKELETLNQQAIRKDDEARAREREDREAHLRRATELSLAATLEFNRWQFRESVCVVVVGVGIGFATLLLFLPHAPWKIWLYVFFLGSALLGAWQKERARRRAAQIMMRASEIEGLKFPTRKWRAEKTK